MARALYNLGNVYHAKGKNAGRYANQDPGEFPPDVKESLEKAAHFYEWVSGTFPQFFSGAVHLLLHAVLPNSDLYERLVC